MPGISQCPECNQQISLPRQTHPETRVQCPICNAEYALRLALDLAPPALIVVQEAPGAAQSAGAWADDAGGAWEEDSLATRTLPSMSATSASDDFELDERDLDDARNLDDSGIASRSGVVARGPGIVEGETVATQSPSDIPTMAPLKKKRKNSSGTRSMVRMMIGIVGGAVVGLSLGLAVLFALGKDPFGVAKMLPEWMVPDSLPKAQAKPKPSSKEGSGDAAQSNSLQDAVAKFTQAANQANKEEVKETKSADGGETEEFNTDPSEATDPLDPALAGDVGGPKGVKREDVDDVALAQKLIGPKNLHVYSGVDLGAALKAAQGARDFLVKDNGGALVPEHVKAYKQMCVLAEALMSIKDENEPGLQFNDRREAAKKFLDEFSRNKSAITNLRQLGASWYGSKNRDMSGALFVGKVQEVVEREPFYVCMFSISGESGPTIPVFTKDKPSWKPDSTVVLMGAIVDNPYENLAGYVGEEKRVVWSDTSLSVSRP